MVSTEYEKVLGVLDLVGKEQADCLQGLLAAVDIVAEEEVVGLGREAAVLEQAQEVVVLSVYVTADLDMASVFLSSTTDGERVVALTFMGASSSRRMGWEMKISRALVHRYLISVSNSCTCLPGLLPRTSKSLSMMESRSTSFSAIAVTCCWLRYGGEKKPAGEGVPRAGWGTVGAGGGCVVVLCVRALVSCFSSEALVHRADHHSPAAVMAPTHRHHHGNGRAGDMPRRCGGEQSAGHTSLYARLVDEALGSAGARVQRMARGPLRVAVPVSPEARDSLGCCGSTRSIADVARKDT